MKSLFKYVMEASIDAKKQFIKDAVDELNEETLNRIYSIINSVSPEAQQQINKFMNGIGLTFIQDNILGILEKGGDLLHYIDYINSNKMLKFGKIVNNESGNIFDILQKNTPFNLTTLQRLAKEKSSSTGVQVGDYEFLLRLMVANASQTLTCKRGDVTADDIAVEVKSGKPRITGAGTKPPEIIRNTLNKMLNDKYPGKIEQVTNKDFNGNGGMKVPGRFFENLYETISDFELNTQAVQDSVTEILTKSYVSQWPDNMVNYIDTINKFVGKHLFSGKRINTSSINSIIASVCLFCYSCTENFDRFLVFNKVNGDFICIDTTKKDDKLIEDIYDKFINDHFHITSMQNEMNNLTGKGIQFTLK